MRHARLALQAPQQPEDLRLHGHVERGRRLVGDQQLRPAGERERHRDPLRHAARQLIRAQRSDALGVGQLDEPQQLERARSGARARAALVAAHDLHQLAADRERRIEARLRLLRDVRERAAAQRVELALAHRQQLALVPAHAAGDRLEAGGQQPQQRERRDALAAAGLADDAERLARQHVEAHALDEQPLAVPAGERNRQVAHRQQRVLARRCGRAARRGPRLQLGAAAARPRPARARAVHHRRVAHGVAEQAEREDRERDHGARRDQQPRLLLGHRRCLRDHAAPRRRRRVGRQPQVGDRRLEQQRVGGEHRRLHDDRPGHARQHVAHDDPPVGQARRARRRHVQLVAHLQRRAAHDAQHDRRAEDPERHHRRVLVARQHGQHDEDQDDPRDREQQLGPAAQQAVGPAAYVAGREPERHADCEHDRDALDDRLQAAQAAVQQAAQHIAPERVGAEQVVRSRSGEEAREVLLERIVRRDQRCQQAGEDEQREEPERRDRDRPAQQIAQRNHETRTRGSSQPYARSTSTFMTITITVK